MCKTEQRLQLKRPTLENLYTGALLALLALLVRGVAYMPAQHEVDTRFGAFPTHSAEPTANPVDACAMMHILRCTGPVLSLYKM